MSGAVERPAGRFGDRVALVTGGASGIGEATASRLAAEGATVIVADVDFPGAEMVAEEIVADGGRARPLSLDVASEAMWEACLGEILTAERRLDILVCSAGISHGAPLPDLELADWKRVFAINVEGVFLGTKHSIRAMRRRGGNIVHVSSLSGIRPAPGAAAYSCSKAAVRMFTQVAARECQENGWPIRVNCVSPGGVKTPMWRTMPFFRELVSQHGSEAAAFDALAGPGGRFAEPDEVALAILSLADDRCSSQNGADVALGD